MPHRPPDVLSARRVHAAAAQHIAAALFDYVAGRPRIEGLNSGSFRLEWYSCSVDIETRVNAMEKRFDRRLDAITKLLQQGMRMLARTDSRLADLAAAQKRADKQIAALAEAQRELAESQTELARSQKELARSQRELAEAQKATDRSLRALIDSLRNGRNGR